MEWFVWFSQKNLNLIESDAPNSLRATVERTVEFALWFVRSIWFVLIHCDTLDVMLEKIADKILIGFPFGLSKISTHTIQCIGATIFFDSIDKKDLIFTPFYWNSKYSVVICDLWCGCVIADSFFLQRKKKKRNILLNFVAIFRFEHYNWFYF